MTTFNQCFKKENSRYSEMGTFIFKVSLKTKTTITTQFSHNFHAQLRLSDVDDVALLTKKGYLTISLSHTKDGKVFLRRHEGIKEWYSMIKVRTEYSLIQKLLKGWGGGGELTCDCCPFGQIWPGFWDVSLRLCNGKMLIELSTLVLLAIRWSNPPSPDIVIV